VTGAPPAPGYGYPGPLVGYPPPVPAAPGEPNPVIAAILGFIPGVGAMYNEQYAKGIVHLIVFVVLVSLASDVNGIFGLFIAGWEFYMAIEAHHTARARRDGTPLPNPFGLNDLSERLGFGKAWPLPGAPVDPAAKFVDPNPSAANPGPPPTNPYAAPPYSYTYVPPVSNWGAPLDTSVQPNPLTPNPELNQPFQQRFPTGAIWLIGLGLLFLVGNSPVFYFLHGRFLGPLLVIGVGVWIFVRKMTSTGQGIENDGTPLYHWRLMQAIGSAIWVLLTGVIWLLDEARILTWSRSWPIYLIAAGVIMFAKRTAYSGYPAYPPPATPAPPVAPVATTEMIQTTPPPIGSNDQEGR
jgi:TM2 domain-containing membrane protein YozV